MIRECFDYSPKWGLRWPNYCAAGSNNTTA
jgi:hypothetical protein